MKLSLIVPCYNEEGNVKPFAQKVQDVFDYMENDYEIIFINDGSTDKTLFNLKELRQKSAQNIKIISFSRNFGKEAAMYAGMQNCCGDYIAVIDVDMQQNPELVRNMTDILDSDNDIDCVCACQEKRKENKLMSAVKSCFYHAANKYTDIDFVDGASDFRTFRSTVKDAILSMDEYFRFSKGIFSWVGFNTKYIPYIADERASGSTKWSFTKLLKYAKDGIISFSTAPLKFAAIVGSLATLFSIIYFIVTLIRWLVSDINVDGFTQIVILISFFGGVQLFTVGIMGEYLAKNYIETKHRPIYIAKEIIDCKNKKTKDDNSLE